MADAYSDLQEENATLKQDISIIVKEWINFLHITIKEIVKEFMKKSVR